MTVERLIGVISAAVLILAVGVGVVSWLLSLLRRPAAPDPVDAHAATVPTDEPDTVPMPIDDLEAAWALPDYIREDHR